MLTDNSPSIELTTQEREYLQKIQAFIDGQFVENSLEVFDVLRWCHGKRFQKHFLKITPNFLAYNGDLETAAKKFKRHLKIRKVLQLDHICRPNSGHEIDEHADAFAPMSYLGNVQFK